MQITNFYDRLDEQEAIEYDERIKILSDLRDYFFEIVYRKDGDRIHRTVSSFDDKGKLIKSKSEFIEMLDFSKKSVEKQFDHFISEEWSDYT